MKTIIMAGGKGTRIAGLFPDVPKPLIPINNIPVLEYEISSLALQGFCDIIITVSYLADKIMAYFGDGTRLGVKIEYFIEKTPLGNAGALFKIRNKLGKEPFLLLNADAMFDINFNRMIEFHKKKHALVTLFTHPNSHPYDSGLIIADKCNRVERWLTKEDKRPEFYKNRVNAGLHVIDPYILDETAIDIKKIGEKSIKTGEIIKADLDRQILKPLQGTGRMFCYDSPEYVKDIGTPDRYNAVVQDYNKGIVTSKSLIYKQKAIFLDRDGTINKYVGFLRDIKEFELLPSSVDAIKKINVSGYLCIVVTNQPVIARGEVTYAQLEEIHNKMETLLGLEGAYIDGLYFCPHHPDKGYKGEIKELKIACTCRKPEPGMLLKAAEEFNINLNQSWMVGDGINDILAGKKVGCHTALLSYEHFDYGQDITSINLLEAVTKILK